MEERKQECMVLPWIFKAGSTHMVASSILYLQREALAKEEEAMSDSMVDQRKP